MKLKQHPDDFRVEELTDLDPSADGPFAFYRLEKRGWSTPDALQAVRQRWKIDLQRVSCGGLKDRHAHTIQYFSIFRGPQRNLSHNDVGVTYLGQRAEPYASSSVRGNLFRLTLRDLNPDEVTAAQAALEAVRVQGVPNYFDDQRFGSVSPEGREFIAKSLVLGHFEEALRLALAAPYAHDRAAAKREKAVLREHWGDWPLLRERLPRGHPLDVVSFLAHRPDDFRGAVSRLHPELHGLYLAAYQSHLWNRMLARWLEQQVPAEHLSLIQVRLGTLPFPRQLSQETQAALSALRLPLPSSRQKLDEDDPRLALMRSVLAEEGLEPRQLQVKGVRTMFFSKGDRAALCLPAHLEHERGTDEKHPGRQKLTLSFELPRGAYATLIVKRITVSPSPASVEA